MTNDVRDKGIEKFNEVYCGDLPQPPEEGQDRFFDFMLGSLFGQLWSDDTLSIKERRLVLLGAIAAQGEEMTFNIQVRSALKRGDLSVEQVNEVVLFLTQYVGYPKASKMRMAIANTLKEFSEGGL